MKDPAAISYEPHSEASPLPRVSELLRELNRVLEDNFAWVRVAGELSNLKSHRSGHLYFVLKDEEAQIRGVMFRLDRRYLPFVLEEGMEVVVEGELEIYPARGELTLIARRIEPLGLGALLQALKELRERLEKEGLFAPERKRPLPFYPRRVGVVTSPQGAAIQDILRISRRRNPGIDILISPTRVQGIGAEEEVVAALKRIYKTPVDVIILARGGGSVEDLWTFNTEIVVRAVAQSPVPLVSAVGHETDTTLCDLAADLRASTPSAAAELVFPSLQELRERIAREGRELALRIQTGLHERWLILKGLKGSLPSPRLLWEQKKERLKQVQERFRELTLLFLERKRYRLAHMAATLNTLNPLTLLERGYAIVWDEGEHIVTRAGSLSPGARMRIRFHDGEVLGRVSEVKLGAAQKTAKEKGVEG